MASASVLLLAFKMRQWDAGKKQGGTLQGGFLDFLLTHFEFFAFCFMLKPWGYTTHCWYKTEMVGSVKSLAATRDAIFPAE